MTPMRLDIDHSKLPKGLGKLVLTILEVVRELLERLALQRMEANTLSEEEIEKLGFALQTLDEKMTLLCDLFELDRKELQLDLGPLGKLL